MNISKKEGGGGGGGKSLYIRNTRIHSQTFGYVVGYSFVCAIEMWNAAITFIWFDVQPSEIPFLILFT